MEYWLYIHIQDQSEHKDPVEIQVFIFQSYIYRRINKALAPLINATIHYHGE